MPPARPPPSLARMARPPHAGQVVRRVLLCRSIAIDAETAQLVAAAVQAALQAGAPSGRRAGARVFPPPTASRCSDMAPGYPPTDLKLPDNREPDRALAGDLAL